MILAGDVGGTNTRLAYFEHGKKVLEQKYSSRASPNLEDMIQKFLQIAGKKASKACFGVAGPVLNGKCKATNLQIGRAHV